MGRESVAARVGRGARCLARTRGAGARRCIDDAARPLREPRSLRARARVREAHHGDRIRRDRARVHRCAWRLRDVPRRDAALTSSREVARRLIAVDFAPKSSVTLALRAFMETEDKINLLARVARSSSLSGTP